MLNLLAETDALESEAGPDVRTLGAGAQSASVGLWAMVPTSAGVGLVLSCAAFIFHAGAF